VVSVGGTLAGGMGVALLVNREFPGRRLVRTLMLAPYVVPSFVVAVLWGFMFQSDSGVINRVLVDVLGIFSERPAWLLDHSLLAIIVPTIWRGMPLAMLIFLAGLQSLPRELYDAAAIDGAGPWQRFRYITMPLLRPVALSVILLGVIYTFKVFDVVYVLTGGGPVDATMVLPIEVYNVSLKFFRFGEGAAESTLLLLAMLMVATVYLFAQRREEGRP
jgi:multiple sugar transport system permease protein